MHFVDDENLIAVADGRHAEAGDDHLADLVDLRVGGGVDLEDVDVASLCDLDARVADTARIRRGTLLAVQRARENARGGGLADAARPREDERLRDTLRADRVTKRLGHAALADHVIETLRAPLARENLIRQWSCSLKSGV